MTQMLQSPAIEELDALINDFVTINYSTKVARENVKYYLVWLKRFLVENNLRFDELKPADIIRFRTWLSTKKGRHGRPLAPKTIRQLLSLVKSFYDFLETIGYYNPFKDLPTAARKKITPRTKSEKVPREFSDEELEMIFSYLRTANSDVYLACLIAFATGARLQEVLNLKAEDVVIKDSGVYVIIRAGKGLKERVSIVGVPSRTVDGKEISKVISKLNEEARKKLIERVKEVGKGYLFGDELRRKRVRKNIQQTLYRLSKKLGIELHFHNFRSNWGAKALAAGVPLEYVSRQLGHAYTSTTERYYARVKDEYVIAFINSLL
ncbi:MAG: tyrosine-type recombinase/integrase [Candidatus Njordarchaeales archaeon]